MRQIQIDEDAVPVVPCFRIESRAVGPREFRLDIPVAQNEVPDQCRIDQVMDLCDSTRSGFTRAISSGSRPSAKPSFFRATFNAEASTL